MRVEVCGYGATAQRILDNVNRQRVMAANSLRAALKQSARFAESGAIYQP
jgi:hypothetical protein